MLSSTPDAHARWPATPLQLVTKIHGLYRVCGIRGVNVRVVFQEIKENAANIPNIEMHNLNERFMHHLSFCSRMPPSMGAKIPGIRPDRAMWSELLVLHNVLSKQAPCLAHPAPTRTRARSASEAPPQLDLCAVQVHRLGRRPGDHFPLRRWALHRGGRGQAETQSVPWFKKNNA